MVTIYFNRWFSSIGSVMDELKETFGEKVHIIASAKDPNRVYRANADEFIIEDWKAEDGETSAGAYTRWALNLCREKKVNVFFVKEHSLEVSKHRKEFEELGVYLVVEREDVLETLANKGTTYEKLLASGKELGKFVPQVIYYPMGISKEYVDDFMSELKNSGIKYCIKKKVDEGGVSFRKLIKKREDTLDSYYGACMTFDEAADMILKGKLNDNYIIMQMLNGAEISVDCCVTSDGLKAICRKKLKNRVQEVFYSEELKNLCEKISKQFGLEHIFNIQFMEHKESDGTTSLYLLEVNTRMSGGVYMEQAFGCSLPVYYLLDKFTELKPLKQVVQPEELLGGLVSHIEKAVIIKEWDEHKVIEEIFTEVWDDLKDKCSSSEMERELQEKYKSYLIRQYEDGLDLIAWKSWCIEATIRNEKEKIAGLSSEELIDAFNEDEAYERLLALSARIFERARRKKAGTLTGDELGGYDKIKNRAMALFNSVLKVNKKAASDVLSNMLVELDYIYGLSNMESLRLSHEFIGGLEDFGE